MDSITEIKRWAEGVMGRWNGDEPGRLEDNAMDAKDILEKIKEIEELINEINDF